jgi:aspartate aminotransferase
MVLLADGKPVIIETDIKQNFKITPQQLEQNITDKTKLLVLNSPSNPTGAVYTKAELEALAEVLRKHPNIFIISDDIYEHIRFENDKFYNIAMVAQDLKDRIVILNGVSKAYAMTGWRIGYGAGHATIIKAMKKIQSQSTSNPSSIAQAASVEALNGSQDCIQIMLEAFSKRHDFIVKKLNEIEGVECNPSDGAFYAFPKVEGLIKRLGLKDDVELSTMCLEKLNIALVPGSAFGAKNYIRFSFATSMSDIEEALKRLSQL